MLQSGRTVLEYYRGRLGVALMALFPDIGLQKSDFSICLFPIFFFIVYIYIYLIYYVESKGKFGRRFFTKFAADRGFDPTSAKDWYKIKRSDICATKVSFVIFYYKKIKKYKRRLTLCRKEKPQ